MSQPLGVGIIGTGVATQAIHLPLLSTLPDRFRVVHIVGRDERTAAAVAATAKARHGTSVEALLDDPEVDIVAICSPDRLHAEHVTAACAARKRGVLVEKPMALTTEEVERVRDASIRSGVPVVVGAMHSWDPAWSAASQAWLEAGGRTHLIRSCVHLPVNSVMVPFATELVERGPRRGRRLPPGVVARLGAARRMVRRPDARAQEARLGDLILGFAVHVIPLVRVLSAGLANVSFARPSYPWGYAIAYETGTTSVTMTGSIGGRWAPTWTLDAWSEDRWLHVDLPPAFVMAGSAEASISSATGRTTWRSPKNGYITEWLHLADAVEGRTELAISISTASDDMLHAISLTDAAAARLRQVAER